MSDLRQKLEVFSLLCPGWLSVLVKGKHCADGLTLEQLSREGSGGGDQEVTHGFHVFLEGRHFVICLFKILNFFLCIFIIRVTGQSLLFRQFLGLLLVSLDLSEGLSKRIFGLDSMDQYNWRLKLLLSVASHFQQFVQERLIVV